MKFGVHLVWSMWIVKSKKIEKIYFSDDFLSWMVHCVSAQPEILIFFSLSQTIDMLGISKKSGTPEGMFILLSKSENGGICFTHVHCA